MQTATSETDIKSRYLSICVHHYTLRAPCPKGQGNTLPEVPPSRDRPAVYLVIVLHYRTKVKNSDLVDALKIQHWLCSDFPPHPQKLWDRLG